MKHKRSIQSAPVAEPVFITPRQLSERWLCSIEKLKRMRRAGSLPVSYLGRSARYRLADVLKIEAEAAAQ
jgi:DNA-binding transcriptional regulator PaaX